MAFEFQMPQILEGEEIKIFLRKHIMFLVAPLATIAAIMILPTIGVLILSDFVPILAQSPIKNFIILFMSAYSLILCGVGLFIWFRYYFSYLIVSNLRLIEIEQKSIFDRTTSELELIRIEDVKALVRGILPTLLHYGDVLVETAGATTQNFLFEKIPNANYVSSQILELSQISLGEHAPEVGGRMASVINKPPAKPVQNSTAEKLDDGLGNNHDLQQKKFYPDSNIQSNESLKKSEDQSENQVKEEQRENILDQNNAEQNETAQNKVLYDKNNNNNELEGSDKIDSP
jgi:hypothetical protein